MGCPECGSSVNNIPTKGADCAHHITAYPSDLKTYLVTSLHKQQKNTHFIFPAKANPTELSLPPVDSTSCNFMENRGQIAWLFWVVCNIWEERRAGQTMIDILTQTVVWRYEIHLCFDPQNGLKYFLKKNSNILSKIHRTFLQFFDFGHDNFHGHFGCARPITKMGSVMWQFYYWYWLHYEIGVHFNCPKISWSSHNVSFDKGRLTRGGSTLWGQIY